MKKKYLVILFIVLINSGCGITDKKIEDINYYKDIELINNLDNKKKFQLLKRILMDIRYFQKFSFGPLSHVCFAPNGDFYIMSDKVLFGVVDFKEGSVKGKWIIENSTLKINVNTKKKFLDFNNNYTLNDYELYKLTYQNDKYNCMRIELIDINCNSDECPTFVIDYDIIKPRLVPGLEDCMQKSENTQ